MSHVARYALTIVAGGLALGAVLGAAADPEMKRPAAQWWQQTGRSDPSQASGSDSWPAIAPAYPVMADSYRPDLDYDTVVTSYWDPPANWSWYGEDDIEAAAPSSSPDASVQMVDPSAEAAAEAAEEVADAALQARTGPASADPAADSQLPLTEEGLY